MFYNKDIQTSVKELNTNIETGLSKTAVLSLKEMFGENSLKGSKKKSIVKAFFEQLKDFMIYILMAAAIISAVVGEFADAIIIFVVILLNALIGVIQEFKAEKSLDALKKLSTPKALVRRDSEIIEIASEEIVPGDVVILDAGRYIPCDLRLIEDVNLKVDESALTGESEPVLKDSTKIIDSETAPLGDRINMAYMSTLVTSGRGVGIAASTGMNTEIGKIASMLSAPDNSKTPLQKKLEELGKILGLIAVGISILIFIIGLFQGRETLEIFMTAISLAVAAIPEGLPAIVTIVLALGVTKMSKKNAIIRKLPAVETLGAVNVICSDKTGTLTQNKMTVLKFYTNNLFDSKDNIDINNKYHRLLLEGNVLCNDATYSPNNSTGDPTEIALLEIGYNFGITKDDLNSSHKRISELPFDSDRKLMTTVNKYDNENYSFTKGAVDNLLGLCTNVVKDGAEIPLTEEIKDEILSYSKNMSDDALRVLALAYKKLPDNLKAGTVLESDLTFIGLVGMIDPPREEVKASIQLTKLSGIKTIMITGDHKDTAYAIGHELGIVESKEQVMLGSELNKISTEDLALRIDNYRVFARVSPEHKVKIVEALRSKNNIVSMTGDGVNDAPSLKAADIGVAMGITGTDVSKGASDMILTDDNFSTIVEAIKQGRNIYKNIKKSILFLLSCNFGEIVAILASILLNLPTPLRAIHLLWVNLITDTLPALSLGVDPGDDDVMKDKPRNPHDSLFKGSVPSLVINGLLIGLLTIGAFLVGGALHSETIMTALKTFDYKLLINGFSKLAETDAIYYPQTMAFIVLSVSQLVHSLNMRSDTKSIFTIGFFTNKYLIGSIVLGILIQFSITVIPFLASIFKVVNITLTDWFIVALFSIIPLIVNEIHKMFLRAKQNKIS